MNVITLSHNDYFPATQVSTKLEVSYFAGESREFHWPHNKEALPKMQIVWTFLDSRKNMNNLHRNYALNVVFTFSFNRSMNWQPLVNTLTSFTPYTTALWGTSG